MDINDLKSIIHRAVMNDDFEKITVYEKTDHTRGAFKIRTSRTVGWFKIAQYAGTYEQEYDLEDSTEYIVNIELYEDQDEDMSDQPEPPSSDPWTNPTLDGEYQDPYGRHPRDLM